MSVFFPNTLYSSLENKNVVLCSRSYFNETTQRRITNYGSLPSCTHVFAPLLSSVYIDRNEFRFMCVVVVAVPVVIYAVVLAVFFMIFNIRKRGTCTNKYRQPRNKVRQKSNVICTSLEVDV